MRLYFLDEYVQKVLTCPCDSHCPICSDLPCLFLHAINLRVICAQSHSSLFSLINETFIVGLRIGNEAPIGNRSIGHQFLWNFISFTPVRRQTN